jgi:hypothetical protein
MGTRRLSIGCTFVQWSQLPVHAVFQVEPVLDGIATIRTRSGSAIPPSRRGPIATSTATGAAG